MTREEAKIREYLIENIEKEEDGEKKEKQCHQLLRLGKKWKDDKAIGCAYYYLSLYNMERGNYQSSIENVQDALPYLKKSQDFYRYTRAFNTQGISYSELGNEVVALESYLDGMDSARENHIPDMQVYFYNNIASRFQDVKEHRTAISYLVKAQKYFSIGKRKEHFPYKVLMVIYMNMGSSYTYLGEYKKAEEALLESMKLARENQDDTYRFSHIYLFSTLYWRMGKREYAYEHLDELVDLVENGSCIYDYTQNITEFIELLTEMEEYEKMDQVIGFYEDYVKKQDSIYLYITAVEFRLAYYERLGDEEKYQKYALIYTRLSREQKKQMLSDRAQSIKMKIDLKEKEIERQHAQRREERLKMKSEKDALTGLGNRYFLDRYSKQIIARAVKEQRIICIGVLDVDCFKQYNDTYGHLAGDKCLMRVSAIVAEKIEKRGKAFRYGGDEIVVLMENVTEDDILQIAGEIKRRLEEERIAHRNSTVKRTVTLSQGYACLMPRRGASLNQILECADAVLYEVKEAGKDNYKVTEYDSLR